MPRDAVSESRPTSMRSARTPTSWCSSSPASTSATSPTTSPRSRSTTCACARPSTWRSTRRRSSTRCSSVPALPPRTRSRRRCGRTTMRSRTIRTIRPQRRSSWRRPATRTASRPTCGPCRCSAPTTRTRRRIAELMQADLAKVGITAEIKSYEWGEYRKRMQNGEHQMGMLGLDRRQRRSGQLPRTSSSAATGPSPAAATWRSGAISLSRISC